METPQAPRSDPHARNETIIAALDTAVHVEAQLFDLILNELSPAGRARLLAYANLKLARNTVWPPGGIIATLDLHAREQNLLSELKRAQQLLD